MSGSGDDQVATTGSLSDMQAMMQQLASTVAQLSMKFESFESRSNQQPAGWDCHSQARD